MAPPPKPPLPIGGDQNRAHKLLGASWTLFAISACLVIARMYTRIVIQHNVGWDDWMILFTLVGANLMRRDELLIMYLGICASNYCFVHCVRCSRRLSTHLLFESSREDARHQIQLYRECP